MTLKHIIAHINTNSGFYSLLSTLLMSILTTIYVILTFKLLKETKKSRENQTRPFIYIDFEVRSSLIYFKIKNAGNSPANNINIDVDRDFKNVPKTLDYLPPGRELLYNSNLIVDYNSKLDDSDLCKINVKYYGIKNKQYSNEYKIDLTTYIDMASHNKNDIAEHLKDISKAMKGGNNSIISKLGQINKNLK